MIISPTISLIDKCKTASKYTCAWGDSLILSKKSSPACWSLLSNYHDFKSYKGKLILGYNRVLIPNI